MNRTLSVIAAILASVALVTAYLNKAGRSDSIPATTASHPVNSLVAELEELQKNQQALKESNRELLNKVTQLESAKGSVSTGTVELAWIQERLDQLETKQAQLTQATRDIDKHGVIAGLERELGKAYSTLMDTNQTLVTRVRQADTLKRNGQFDDRAVKVMIELYGQTDNFGEKAGVLNALSGFPSPALRDLIIEDLNAVVSGGYTDPRFRYTAIEALEPMAQDPTVAQWLGHLAQNDPEPKLAGRAGQALGVVPPATPVTPKPAR